jgi:hypothetical protein
MFSPFGDDDDDRSGPVSGRCVALAGLMLAGFVAATFGDWVSLRYGYLTADTAGVLFIGGIILYIFLSGLLDYIRGDPV